LKSRLLLLDLILAALVVALGFRFRQVWLDARGREQRILHSGLPAERAQPLPPLPAYKALVAAGYIEIPRKTLFAKDRNSDVIIDVTPPPAPPPMPALPVFYGLMTAFGDHGIILSEKPGAAQKTYRSGEKVGAFKLLAFDNARITFDWDGKKVERRLEELIVKGPPPPEPNVGPAVAAAPAPSAAPTVKNLTPEPLGPGEDIGGGMRACQVNDSIPAGAVQGGLRKVEVTSPFGKTCKWVPVK